MAALKTVKLRVSMLLSLSEISVAMTAVCKLRRRLLFPVALTVVTVLITGIEILSRPELSAIIKELFAVAKLGN